MGVDSLRYGNLAGRMASNNSEILGVLMDAIKKIATGSELNGMPLPREQSRQIAREALVAIGEPWPVPAYATAKRRVSHETIGA